MDNDIHPLNNWGQLVIIQDVGALRKLILFVFFFVRLMKNVSKPLFKLQMNWSERTSMNLIESNRGLFSSFVYISS